MSHLNEDNNTRVLFERVLAQGTLSSSDSLEIWNKFLEFESNIGDLASVVKVEKRRATVLEDCGLSLGKPTVQVVDRYRFMTLLPLGTEELRSIGYGAIIANSGLSSGGQSGGLQGRIPVPGQANASLATASNGHSSGPGNSGSTDQDIVRPDYSQMVPFKPKVNWRPGEFMLPGGSFPPPPSAGDLLKLLPPPSCFQGPHVIVDRLMETFAKIRLPDKMGGAGDSGHSTKLFDLAKSVHWVVDDR